MCGVGPERGDPMPDKTLCQEGLGFRVYGLGWDPMPDKTLCEEAGVPEAANSLKHRLSRLAVSVHILQVETCG